MKERLEALFEAVQELDEIIILPHNNPDPDAIASAVALRYLLSQKLNIKCQIVYRGIIGRAENKALVRYLNHPLHRVNGHINQPCAPFALVDTQPGAGNNALPAGADIAVVIDHHPQREVNGAVNYIDVRPSVGAACSIMTEYLRLAQVGIPSFLATALFYGIKTDTMGLGRGTGALDMEAICYLLPKIDLEALLKIERAQVPVNYFKNLAEALNATRIYNNVAISFLGPMQYPDLTAETADFLLRMKGVEWVICMGIHKERLIISVRTQKQTGAGQFVQAVVGEQGVAGGHGSMAGGQIIIGNRNADHLAEGLIEKMRQHLHVSDIAGKTLTT
ncbi:MAG: DHH family phosphoesterase [Anaerolineaceae bacterium]|nr:DHH family phosphoesterase [Anaerolineaceae bacterium]MCB9098973.1 DHH family phosphoesterase [Anaerolineales bacterium]